MEVLALGDILEAVVVDTKTDATVVMVVRTVPEKILQNNGILLCDCIHKRQVKFEKNLIQTIFQK